MADKLAGKGGVKGWAKEQTVVFVAERATQQHGLARTSVMVVARVGSMTGQICRSWSDTID
ncbi:hypothetical protein [Orrella marina]|uniref:hypothetical protein n=1 Tax=Orrella marina TaxID=2163011 RepID=UPI00131EDC65|nr:hypothetical protein [Orrella marina]